MSDDISLAINLSIF